MAIPKLICDYFEFDLDPKLQKFDFIKHIEQKELTGLDSCHFDCMGKNPCCHFDRWGQMSFF